MKNKPSDKVIDQIFNDIHNDIMIATKNHKETPVRKRSKDNLGYMMPVNPKIEHQNSEYLIKRFIEQVEKAKIKYPQGFVTAFDIEGLPN